MKPKLTPGCSDMGVTEESPKSVSKGQARGRRARAPGGAGSGRASPRGAAVSRPEEREGTWGGPVVGGFHLGSFKTGRAVASLQPRRPGVEGWGRGGRGAAAGAGPLGNGGRSPGRGRTAPPGDRGAEASGRVAGLTEALGTDREERGRCWGAGSVKKKEMKSGRLKSSAGGELMPQFTVRAALLGRLVSRVSQPL